MMKKSIYLAVTNESNIADLRIKLVNHVMRQGKKSIAQCIVNDAFSMIEKKHGKNAEEVFRRALDQVFPRLEVSSRRVGGANYQIPKEISPRRRVFLGMKWLLDAARSRKRKPMAARLADEIIAAANNEGAAVKKKEDIHKMAEANRAFAHFARF